MTQPMWTPKDPRRIVRAVEDLPREPREDMDGKRGEAAPRPPRQSSGEQVREHGRNMEAMGTLAGGIAHVFNNMLTAIGFETELALSRLPADHPARKHLREIEKVGERGASLARQLLAFSGSQVLHPRPLQLNNLLRDLGEGLRRLVGEAIELALDLDPDLDPVQADPEQLEQAISNLVVNARDAMPGGGKLTLRTANVELKASDLADPARSAPGRYVLLSVADDGPGMEEEVRQRAFEPFFTTKQGTGAELAGLGLATVYGIVAQSGGQILVESAPDEGTTFLLYLPSLAEARQGAGAAAGENWETILLVEDEDNVRKPLAEILAAKGYQVLEAADGAEAIALSQRHRGPIHLMVTDILMGAMSGVELAERLSFQRPEMKVLYATGYPAGLAERPSLVRDGAPLLKKPFTARVLAAKIREVLESPD